MFPGRQVRHHLHQIADHLPADPPNERCPLLGDADHYFAAVFPRARAHDVAQIFESIDQPACRSRRVTHLLRDLGHGQHFFQVERREKEKLWEGNVARGELLGEMQDETSLHLQNDVRQPLGIGAELIGSVDPDLGLGIQTG